MRRVATPLVMAAAALTALSAWAGGTTAVQIELPEAARIDTSGIRRILVGGFLTNEYERFDLQKEMSRLLRTDLKKSADFLILDDPPVNLPEQSYDDLKLNAPFFETVAADYRADLIISGQITYGSADRSAFAQEEYISPISGRRTIRSRYVDRTGFDLRLDLIFVRGSDGALLYDTSFFQDEIVNGDDADPLAIFYELTERFRERYLGILVPRQRNETRYLFED